MRRFAKARPVVAALVLAAAPGWTPLRAAPAPASETYEVRLDGKPIGTHRFTITVDAEHGTTVRADARFDVRLLGVTLYRYRHRVEERWADGCLHAISARTDDNGHVADVEGQSEGDGFEIRVRSDGRPTSTSVAAARCLWSFAYWNPALAGQTRLLDPGTGRVEAVTMTAAAPPPPDLAQLVQAPLRGLHIGGLAEPIDVWYAGERWVGLDTIVRGGRRLSYRLR